MTLQLTENNISETTLNYLKALTMKTKKNKPKKLTPIQKVKQELKNREFDISCYKAQIKELENQIVHLGNRIDRLKIYDEAGQTFKTIAINLSTRPNISLQSAYDEC